MAQLSEKNASVVNFLCESTNLKVIAKAEELEARYFHWKDYKRKPNKTFVHSFNVILTSVEVFNGYRPDYWLRIVTDNNLFSGKTIRSTEFTSELKTAILYLRKVGYLKKQDGVRHRKDSSKKKVRKPKWLPFAYTITDKWRSEIFNEPQSNDSEIIRNHLAPYIVLRDTKKRTNNKGKREKYKVFIPITKDHRDENADLFKRTSSVLQAHDELISRTNITLGTEHISSSQAYLRRIFSRNSFDLGGRLYCAMQNKESETRKYLRFDGDPTIEIDYSGIHPSMLYMQKGMNFNPDIAYTVKGFEREDVKIAFNILINSGSNSREASKKTVSDNLGITQKQATKLIDGIYAANEPISEYFNNKNYGLRLQRIDSDIALEIVDHFINVLRRPIIPIHDSFIVSVRDTEDLKLLMVDVYKKIGGIELHPEAWTNGIKATSLPFSKELMSAINECFEGYTENMNDEYWDALISKEPIQGCLEDSNQYEENAEDS